MMKFQTHGPFPFLNWSPEGVDAFYDQYLKQTPSLESAIGVYIVAVKKGSELVPYYVGKTDRRNFGTRLKEHFEGDMLDSLFKEFGSLHFFLLPRVTDTGRFKKPSKNKSPLNSIKHLELSLIGDALLRNPDLLNKKLVKFHSNLEVPGYLRRNVTAEDKSARQLAEMLKSSEKV